jgi:ssDNA-binding Zn-finger/Zn-ribbon topoisomerase 1
MNILINEKKQAQCPSCGKWNNLIIEKSNRLLHEFTCCKRNFVVAIDVENLEKHSKGKKIKKMDDGWWVFKNTE